MPTHAGSTPDVADVAEALHTRLVAAEAVGWGDAGTTYRLSLTDRRVVAARVITGPGAAWGAARIAARMRRLGDAGLPVPVPSVVEAPGGSWLVTPWIDGQTGAAWLDTTDRVRHLADRMGRLARQLRAVDVQALDVDPGDRPPGSVVQHGDFAPINVIVHPDGRILALLDFEHSRLGPPHTDVAWWGWVVRHHHPDAWVAAWPTFLAAAGVDPGDTDLQTLALRELQARAEAAADAETRRRWLDRLTTARAWPAPGLDHAT